LVDGVVITISGSSQGFLDGDGAVAQFNHPMFMFFDDNKNCIYVTDYSNNRIRIIK